jgi:hypothetical protein
MDTRADIRRTSWGAILAGELSQALAVIPGERSEPPLEQLRARARFYHEFMADTDRREAEEAESAPLGLGPEKTRAWPDPVQRKAVEALSSRCLEAGAELGMLQLHLRKVSNACRRAGLGTVVAEIFFQPPRDDAPPAEWRAPFRWGILAAYPPPFSGVGYWALDYRDLVHARIDKVVKRWVGLNRAEIRAHVGAGDCDEWMRGDGKATWPADETAIPVAEFWAMMLVGMWRTLRRILLQWLEVVTQHLDRQNQAWGMGPCPPMPGFAIESVTGGAGSAPEMPTGDAAQPVCPVALNESTKTATVGGERFALTEDQYAFVAAVAAKEGGWITAKEMKIARPDKIREKLPQALRDLICSGKGAHSGYRLAYPPQ